MPTPHSTVTYVEPNLCYHDWQVKDDLERAPRLEDYCIAMNIEVEVSSRDSQISIKEGDKEVLILQWNNKAPEKVSFMAGTKIGGYDYDGIKRTARIEGGQENLTTYYADMYVGDLINYGTTEMVGIKSVNIEYEKSCVPIVTVQFTDVRGLSLFQPTELSRDNTYNGIKGLNKDNVAQSFFQCFFKMPLPKFTIYVKGFYGNPVSYICMCDKFDTNFNSTTGDFDVTARFIGYSYSFMTDISFDALLAAPYSDFEGKKYWDDNVQNGRFWLWDKLHTYKMPMPTLYEVHKDLKKLINSSDSEMEKTTLTEEEKTHEQEIAAIDEIRRQYQQWYEQLFTLLKRKYGKRYCFDFKEDVKKDADWYRILVLTNSKTEKVHDLSEDYKQYEDEFKKTNDDLYAAIDNFNASGYSYKKLKNVSKDFSEYVRINLFNDCYVNKNTRKIEFGGFHKSNTLNRTQIVNRLFHTNVASSETIDEKSSREINAEWINKYGKTIKDFTLSTIYNDGVDQYKDAFIIEVNYSDLKIRRNVLVADSKKSEAEKEKEKARKEHNRIMLGKMVWYPSIENFTKIMMAHLETFMMMMYKIAESCSDRKPEDLGITIGKNGDACDVNEDAGIVPPFPRVVKNEIGDDGITKTVDTWVGEYENGKSFIEADMINGLFNAVEYIQQLVKEEKEAEAVRVNGEDIKPKMYVKHPVTSYDFYLTTNPYGTDNDIVNNPNAFAGKVAMRMFDVLSINNFRKQYNIKFSKSNGEFLKKLGMIEAENFYDGFKITNGTMIGLLGAKADSGTINPQSIINCVKIGASIGGSDDIPWQTGSTDDNLFDSNFWLSRYTTSYSKTQKSYIYPIQNLSFENLDTTLRIFNKGANSIQVNNKDIIVNWIEADANAMTMLESSNDTGFGNIFISDYYKIVSDGLDSANSSPDDLYKDVYDLLHDDSVLNAERYGEMIYTNGVFRPKQGLVTQGKTCTRKLTTSVDSLMVNRNKDSNEMQCTDGETVEYNFELEKLDQYTADVENGNVTSWFLTECRGFDYFPVGNIYASSTNKSLFVQDGYKDNISLAKWGFGGTADKRMGFMLMGFEAIDYTSVSKHLNTNETFTYLPKLAVLQMGAALASMNGIKDVITEETLVTKIMIPRSFGKIINYLNRINYTTRLAYIKYFKDWVLKYNADMNINLLNSNAHVASYYHIDKSTRALFREDSEFISTLSNNLMSPVLISKGNVNHYRGVRKDGLDIDDNTVKMYLDGFLSRLRELCGVEYETKGGDSVKLAKSSNKTSIDMKKELYRYLKLVYDKWVPAMDKESWKYETFFEEEKEALIRGKKGCDGHLFHFIDSFYNKIGDKLLINPKLLSDKIDKALEAGDINTMMLGFMADVYGQNKCMMMCLQNFMDMGSPEGAMNVMFKPIPYNEMPKPHKHPDFVVVYPYEPSKYLNIENGEFNNDTFMLNDEFETPLAVRSREYNSKTCYHIPAFGVSYGKQYQSYFKKVSVGMSSPIATQQAIMAKHAILRASQDGGTKAIAAQDLYDIYATQSYTCKVEMMGCAWIQPLMYFVLTNVPMFRGSYLIMKVNHKITPGNMVTEFTGCRMANVSNRLVDEIFTDEDFDTGYEPYLEYNKGENADIENDCPYKTFPLFEDTTISSSASLLEKAKTVMDILIGYMPSDLDSEKKILIAAGIAGNMAVETAYSFDPNTVNPRDKNAVAAGLVQWNDDYYTLRCMLENNYTGYGYTRYDTIEGSLGYKGKLVTKSDAEKVKVWLKTRGLNYQCQFLINSIVNNHYKEFKTTLWNALKNQTTPDNVADQFCRLYEKPDIKSAKLGDRKNKAKDFYKYYKNQTSSRTSQPDKDIKKDIYQALFDAVQKSIDSTNKGCDLTKEIMKSVKHIDTDGKETFADVMMIKQRSGNTDRLPLVFDILLNGYYDYIQRLWWVSPSDDFKNNPIHIDVVVEEKPKPEKRLVLGMITKQANRELDLRFGGDDSSVNVSFLRSIYKKYQGLNKEIPQFDDKNIFKQIDIQSCDTVGNNGDFYASQGSNSSWAKSVQTMGKWYEKEVHTYQQHINNLISCDLLGGGGVRDNCSGYVSACLQYFGAFKKGLTTSSSGFNSDKKIASILEANKFKKLSYSWETVQPYDIIAYNGHVEILAEKGELPKSWGWGSVHDGINGHAGMPAGTGYKPKGHTYKTIWRYIG